MTTGPERDDDGWDRARFDESMELAMTQLALQVQYDDEERER